MSCAARISAARTRRRNEEEGAIVHTKRAEDCKVVSGAVPPPAESPSVYRRAASSVFAWPRFLEWPVRITGKRQYHDAVLRPQLRQDGANGALCRSKAAPAHRAGHVHHDDDVARRRLLHEQARIGIDRQDGAQDRAVPGRDHLLVRHAAPQPAVDDHQSGPVRRRQQFVDMAGRKVLRLEPVDHHQIIVGGRQRRGQGWPVRPASALRAAHPPKAPDHRSTGAPDRGPG